MTSTPEQLERARKATSDIKAMTGWDLEGYEEFFIELGPVEIPSRFDIPGFGDGDIAVRFDPAGKYTVLGDVKEIKHSHHTEVVEMTSFTGMSQFLPGQQTDIIEIEFAPSGTGPVHTFLNSSDLDVAIMVYGSIMEFRAVIQNSEFIIDRSGPPMIKAEMMASGPVNYQHP